MLLYGDHEDAIFQSHEVEMLEVRLPALYMEFCAHQPCNAMMAYTMMCTN